MRVIVVGLGVQGNKRREHAGTDYVSSVDPNNSDADFNDIRDVNLDTYDAVLACVPDKPKIELLRYCVDHKKHVLVEKPLWVEKDGQIIEPHSISAGLDYPGIGPEHAWLKDIKRVKYVSVTDKEALEAFQLCTKIEGIIPALEPSHALAYLIKKAHKIPKNKIIIMNMCGRGDKDIFIVAKKLKINI